jgi:predicted RNase H-like HicB family nuclease
MRPITLAMTVGLMFSFLGAVGVNAFGNGVAVEAEGGGGVCDPLLVTAVAFGMLAFRTLSERRMMEKKLIGLQRPCVCYPAMTEVTLTTIYEEAEDGGYIGYVAELPGANTQGETLEEARENLSEAMQLILEANREEFEASTRPRHELGANSLYCGPPR